MHKTIKELPTSQRPYEKCLEKGPEVLSDIELLAVILKNGTRDRNSLELAADLLKLTEDSAFHGLHGLLHFSTSELMRLPGIGKVKAVQLKCICELSKRIATRCAKDQLSFHHPATIAAYYMEQLRHEEQEMVIIMFLDTKGRLLGEKVVAKGSVNEAAITPREIYIPALQYHAVSIILVHNHPSGNPQPSTSDLRLTRRCMLAGMALGIQVMDHVIVGDQRYVSLKEEGFIDSASQEIEGLV